MAATKKSDKKDDPIEVKSNEDLSAEELQKQIEEQASASLKPKKAAPKKAEAKPEEKLAKASVDTSKKKKIIINDDTDNPDELIEPEEKVSKKSAEPEPQEEAKPDPKIETKSNDSKIETLVEAEAEDISGEEENDKEKLPSHTGKKIVPLSEQEKNQASEKEDSESNQESKPEASTPEQNSDIPPSGDANSPSQTDEPKSEAAQKLDAISGELKAEVDEKEKAKNEPDQPKIYDTKKYHLPIKATKHHKRGNVSGAVSFLVILLLFAVIFAAAIDMEIFDPGFDLPFDFL